MPSCRGAGSGPLFPQGVFQTGAYFPSGTLGRGAEHILVFPAPGPACTNCKLETRDLLPDYS